MDSILVVDDEKNVRALLTKILSQDQLEVHSAGTGAEGLQLADEVDPDVILLDLRLPDADGMDILKTLKTRRPEAAVIIITAYGQIPSVVEAMKYGATDYLEKPFEPLEKLRLAVGRVLDEVKARREIHRLHQLQARQYGADRIVGDSEATRQLRQMIRQLAQSEAQTILILGESGTGKELVAKGLHYEGHRRDFPFMEVNCAAITETLFESELFGHEKGSFTDAKADQEGPHGAGRPRHPFPGRGERDVARQPGQAAARRSRSGSCGGSAGPATSRSTSASSPRPTAPWRPSSRRARFREDLYYRLNVIPITIPPVRSRREDILPLARHFLLELNSTFHKTIQRLRPRDREAVRDPPLARQRAGAEEPDRAPRDPQQLGVDRAPSPAAALRGARRDGGGRPRVRCRSRWERWPTWSAPGSSRLSSAPRATRASPPSSSGSRGRPCARSSKSSHSRIRHRHGGRGDRAAAGPGSVR